ncbi:MAG: response regulator transcription factor [Desulforhopalus sp.]
MMRVPDGMVFIVDDDPLIRDSIKQLIKSVGLQVSTFSSAREFLDGDIPDIPGCLILDIRMPQISGLELQDELNKQGLKLPIIFISGHGTVPMSVRAMKAGAIDFLQKPFEDQQLLDAIHHAIEKDSQSRLVQREIEEIDKNLALLTSREHEVLLLVAAGMLNKQIASKLNLSENTIKTHRARIMKKMHAESLADLVRKTEKINLQTKSPAPVNYS